jgi:hypothetical protein
VHGHHHHPALCKLWRAQANAAVCPQLCGGWQLMMPRASRLSILQSGIHGARLNHSLLMNSRERRLAHSIARSKPLQASGFSWMLSTITWRRRAAVNNHRAKGCRSPVWSLWTLQDHTCGEYQGSFALRNTLVRCPLKQCRNAAAEGIEPNCRTALAERHITHFMLTRRAGCRWHSAALRPVPGRWRPFSLVRRPGPHNNSISCSYYARRMALRCSERRASTLMRESWHAPNHHADRLRGASRNYCLWTTASESRPTALSIPDRPPLFRTGLIEALYY